MKGFEEHDVLLDGVKHHYAEGPNNGPALVLVPGQSMPWDSYLAAPRRYIAALTRLAGPSLA